MPCFQDSGGPGAYKRPAVGGQTRRTGYNAWHAEDRLKIHPSDAESRGIDDGDTTDNSDWATNCPEYKVTAVEVAKVFHPSEWQKRYQHFSDEQRRLLKERRQRDTTENAEVRR